MVTIIHLFVIRLWVLTSYFQQYFSYIMEVSFVNEVNWRSLFTESNWHCFSYMYETVCSAHYHRINRAIKTLGIQEIHDELSRNCFPFPCIRPQLRVMWGSCCSIFSYLYHWIYEISDCYFILELFPFEYEILYCVL